MSTMPVQPASPASAPRRPRVAMILLSSLAPLVLLIWGIAALDAKMSGWSALAERFPASAEPTAGLETRQTLRVGTWGLVRIKGLSDAAATEEGLYLAHPRILRWTHKPILVPWSELTLDADRRVLAAHVVELRAGAERTRVTLIDGIAKDVAGRVAPSAKDAPPEPGR